MVYSATKIYSRIESIFSKEGSDKLRFYSNNIAGFATTCKQALTVKLGRQLLLPRYSNFAP